MKQFIGICIILLVLIPLATQLHIAVFICNASTLPVPEQGNMILEQTISRRFSIRSWTKDNITQTELSKILWAANGYSQQNLGERTTSSIDGRHPITIFTINSTATYRYIPGNHSLVWWKNITKINMVNNDCWPSFNKGYVGSASVILLLTINTTISNNPYFAWLNTGFIIQNIYLEANSIGLGTVSEGGINPGPISSLLGLPQDYLPVFTIPLGYPSFSYPNAGPNIDIMKGNLPQVLFSQTKLDAAINKVLSTNTWSVENLSIQELSQLLWAGYGYTNITYSSAPAPGPYFHRTVPSAYTEYPIKIYILNASGTFLYLPEMHSLQQIGVLDRRIDVANAAGNSSWAANAPVIFVTVFNSIKPLSSESGWPNFAYVEAGLISQEIFLESQAWNLTTAVIGTGLEQYNGTGAASIRNILGLSGTQVPLCIQPVGHLTRLKVEKVIVRTPDIAGQITSTDPWVQYYANTSIFAQTGFGNLLNITWTFRPINISDLITDNLRTHYTFTWTPSNNFAEPYMQGHLNATASLNASISSSSGWFRLAFKFGRSAMKTIWICKVTIYEENNKANNFSSSWQMGTYISFIIPSNPIEWGVITPNTVNASANSMPFNITISSNIVVKISIKGEGDLLDGGRIPLSNVYVGRFNTTSYNDGISLSTSYQDWKTQIPSSEGKNHSSYWFLSVPSGTPSGTYTFKFFIEVSADLVYLEPKYGLSFHAYFEYNADEMNVLTDLSNAGAFWVRTDWVNSLSMIAWTKDMKTLGNVKILAILDDWMLDNESFTLVDWQSAITTAVQSAPDVDAWEIWNEPDLAMFHFGYMDGTPQHYMNMLQIAYTIIKGINPNALVVGPALSGDSSFLQSIINLGALNYLDVVSVHMYQQYGSYDVSWWNRYKSYVGSKPLWITETGYTTYGYTDAQQNLVLNQELSPSTRYPADRIFWYELVDDWTSSGIESGFGLVRSDYTMKPAYNSFKVLLNMH